MSILNLRHPEVLNSRSFVLQLFDGYTGLPHLEGVVEVRIAGVQPPFEKSDAATFVFFDMKAGNWPIFVRSSLLTPYYVPVTIPVDLPLPDPRWQAYPDVTLADLTKPLDDPDQPKKYRTQRALATLEPTPSYSFPPGATLVRGLVVARGVPLPGAKVVADNGLASTLSDSNGEFVLSFGAGDETDDKVSIDASHPLQAGVGHEEVTLARSA